ncbi:MAG: hypothetical protein GPJ54_13010 [Candidatus Heimdallarchaeota archaeon]|nr:hypothetical protein [Candidatus Heimdallarchaeota archaeon]
MIRHLLFLHPSGVPLFTSSFEKGIDCCSDEHKHHSAVIEKSTLFSSFLTSITMLAGEFGGNLRHLKLGQWDVFVETQEKLTGVILTNPSDDHAIHDTYTEALTEICSEFIITYETDLDQWNGEISKFNSFVDIVNNHEIIGIDSANVELCVSCLEVVSKAIDKLN